MKTYLFSVAAIGVLIAAACGSEAKNDDAKAIQGTWGVVAIDGEGDETLPPEQSMFHFEFKNSSVVSTTRLFWWKSRGNGTFDLDASKNPKTIDFAISSGGEVQGGKSSAIYELEGDRLRICFGRDGQRPTSFRASRRDGQSIFVFKRIKK